MKVEIRVLTMDGATFAQVDQPGQTKQLVPGQMVVIDESTSITINAPAGETPGQGVILDSLP